MPLFGARMVVGTSNYKHVEQFQKDVHNREEKLGEWQKDKKDRKEKLNVLKERIRRGSTTSMSSTKSQQSNKSNTSGRSGSVSGSAVVAATEDVDTAVQQPESGSTGEVDEPVESISVPPPSRPATAQSESENSRKSTSGLEDVEVAMGDNTKNPCTRCVVQ